MRNIDREIELWEAYLEDIITIEEVMRVEIKMEGTNRMEKRDQS